MFARSHFVNRPLCETYLAGGPRCRKQPGLPFPLMTHGQARMPLPPGKAGAAPAETLPGLRSTDWISRQATSAKEGSTHRHRLQAGRVPLPYLTGVAGTNQDKNPNTSSTDCIYEVTMHLQKVGGFRKASSSLMPQGLKASDSQIFTRVRKNPNAKGLRGRNHRFAWSRTIHERMSQTSSRQSA